MTNLLSSMVGATLRKFRSVVMSLCTISVLSLLASCIEPPLHLPDKGGDIEIEFAKIRLDIEVLWSYEEEYEWQKEWFYGWDATDNNLFGTWDIQEPNTFNIRRYFTGATPQASHKRVNEHQIRGKSLTAHYYLGYYDILTWNEVLTLDGVQSLHFDEASSLDYVTAYTNPSTHSVHYAPGGPHAYYQPEFLYSGYLEDLHITENPADYDYYDEDSHTYFKAVKTILDPRTYIYLVQIILHHNRGRIAGVDGTANLSGMARQCNLNTGITGADQIAVNYDVRLKQHCDMRGEDVDIVGGRLFTFGLCNLNPSRVSRASVAETTSTANRIDVEMNFNNGMDSTFVFDVTDQVLRRYKGGVLTIELDVDTIPIPTRPGGSGFDAVVKDYEEEEHEFEM